jgi:hypothetical protein
MIKRKDNSINSFYVNIKDNHVDTKDNNNSNENDKLFDVSRIFGLILLLITIYISLTTSSVKLLKLKLNKSYYTRSCNVVGIPSSWKPYDDDNNARLPLYRYNHLIISYIIHHTSYITLTL